MITDYSSEEHFVKFENAKANAEGHIELPVIFARNVITFPGVVVPMTFNDNISIVAAIHANAQYKTALMLMLRDPNINAPTPEDCYTVGVEIAPGRMIELHDNMYYMLVEGRTRVEVVRFVQTKPYWVAHVRPIQETNSNAQTIAELQEFIMETTEELADYNGHITDDILDFMFERDDPIWAADFITSVIYTPAFNRQSVLEVADVNERLEFVFELLQQEVKRARLRDEMDERTTTELYRTQREMLLREQLRVIQEELGEEDIFQQEIDEIIAQVEAAGMPPEVYAKALKEVNRLQQITSFAPEYSTIRTYLDWLVSIPWSTRSDDNLDLKSAEKILDKAHYGLSKVKDRIIEHIAVRKLAADKMKTPILCFVGPPGVGKTSMGRSIAQALGREFVRVSLGGVRDEAEIRGHRRTYIGALPGRIIQTMRNAGKTNPVFMLDEIDKMGMDFQGDPSAALLEVLDPEQNNAYNDHYLDVDYDLSDILFITTANDLYPLEPALLDRLEVIEFPGYTEEDKIAIARQFLIPQQLEAHGLSAYKIIFQQKSLITIIREYTYEAGVRNLNREIANICRKIARKIAEERAYPKRITGDHISRYLGPPQFLAMRVNDQDAIGLATGLAWTSSGGDTLTIEASVLPGKGNMMLTGQLGDVMQESVQTAMSYMRSRAKDLDLPVDDFDNYDIHIHLPEGAVPKDGPSAGITLAVALISAFTERPIRADWAMTGEITLRGRVLPIGGTREKLLAAHRNRIFNVILPEQNRKDLDDVPPKALKDLNILFADDMQQVMDTILLAPPSEGRQRDRDALERLREEADDDAEDDS
jgi:ATP-dependent Lon protease